MNESRFAFVAQIFWSAWEGIKVRTFLEHSDITDNVWKVFCVWHSLANADWFYMSQYNYLIHRFKITENVIFHIIISGILIYFFQFWSFLIGLWYYIINYIFFISRKSPQSRSTWNHQITFIVLSPIQWPTGDTTLTKTRKIITQLLII